MNRVQTLKRYGSETAYLEHTGGSILSEEALLQQVDSYLQENDLEVASNQMGRHYIDSIHRQHH